MITTQRMTTRFNKELGVMANVQARYVDGVFCGVRVTITDTDADEVVGIKHFPTTMQTEAIAFADAAVIG
jgi:hypothetical protein